MIKKIAISIAAFSAVVGLLAGPAEAAPATDGPAGYALTAQCNMSPGISTTPGFFTYAVEGTADAWATNGAVAIGTTITCYVKDRFTGATYASLSNGMPGPHAQVEGTVVAPPTSYVCARASAVFNDNGSASFNGC